MKGLQALETYKRKSMPLDCAIVDIRLPDIDGLKLLKVIKFNYPGLPVIVITGHGNEATVEEAKNQKADGYLEKPFTMDELASLLDEVNLPEENPEPVETTREAPVPRQSASTYVLLTIDASANLLSVYRKLYFLENVLYCDAVKGEYDLALLLQADSQDRIQEVVEKEIKTIKGVKDVALLDVETPLFGENIIDIIGSVDHARSR
jgi:CheY-like chemotaxis protein